MIHRLLVTVLLNLFGSALFVYVALATRNALAVGASLTLVVLFSGIASAGPAVTLGMVLAGQMSPRSLMPILGGQIAGVVVAAELFKRFTL